MVKYITTAVALKCSSSTPFTRRIYRGLGNMLGGKRRRQGKMPLYYAERLKRMLRLTREHQIVRDGDRILELGTGWLHWEALTLRLFFDVEAVLYDVWDNRQLGGMKNYLGQLQGMLNADFGLSPAELKRAVGLIDRILQVASFDELYKMLGFEYHVESSGSLSRYVDSSFQLVVSAGVLEHVNRGALPLLIPETRRVLKPGGWALHSIDTSDHLAHYAKSVSRKFYLSIPEWKWKLLCENEVQYINRLQRGEWLQLFKGSGFEIIEVDGQTVDISKLKLSEKYKNMDRRELECTVVRLAMKNNSTASARK